jgi:hypothetical protein
MSSKTAYFVSIFTAFILVFSNFSGFIASAAGSEPDVTPPNLRSISVDKQKTIPGDVVTVELDVTDTSAGVETVNVLFTGANRGYFEQDAIYDESKRKYVTKLSITPDSKPGTYSLNSIHLEDKNGNEDTLYEEENDFSHAGFTIINEDSDITPPLVKGISVDKLSAKPGETVTISLDVTDNKSGVGKVSVAYRSKDGERKFGDTDGFWEDAVYNETTQRYEVKFPVNNQTRPGNWKVSSIAVGDNDGNQNTIYNGEDADYSTSNFTVINDQVDITIPVFHSIAVDKKEAKTGDTLKLSLDAEDVGTGIDTINVTFENDHGYYYAHYNPETKKYEVEFPITDRTKPGQWRVSSLYIYDKDNNGLYLEREQNTILSNADFTVLNDGRDLSAPVVGSITIDKKTAKPGDTVTISLDVTDQTKVNYVSIDLLNLEEKHISKLAIFNDKTGKYEVKIPISAYFRPGFWQIVDVYVTDNLRNSELLLYEQRKDFSNGDFYVSNRNLDGVAPKAPIVNGVTDKSKTVTGTAEAKATVIVKAGSKEIGRTIAGTDGRFTVSIALQKGNSELTIVAVDSSENASQGTKVKVKDLTAPVPPQVKLITDQSREVTGITEAGATVAVTIGSKKYTAAKPTDTKGNFKVTIPQQKAGVKISVTAADATKNISSAKMVTVVDKTAPVLPMVYLVSNKSKEVSGKTEASATVTVAIGSKKYTSKPADSRGSYKVTISAQKAGTKVYVTAKDKVGNVSASRSMIVLDKMAPSAPKVKTTVKSKTKYVYGTTEAYATVTIKAGKKVIGTAKADKKGSYKVKIKAQKKNTTLSVTATDKAKNVSSTTTVKVK